MGSTQLAYPEQSQTVMPQEIRRTVLSYSQRQQRYEPSRVDRLAQRHFRTAPRRENCLIDPFMEDVGFELLNRLGTATADYLVITTEKMSNDDSIKEADEPNRVENLLARCSGWNNGYFGSVCLKILSVPDKNSTTA